MFVEGVHEATEGSSDTVQDSDSLNQQDVNNESISSHQNNADISVGVQDSDLVKEGAVAEKPTVNESSAPKRNDIGNH